MGLSGWKWHSWPKKWNRNLNLVKWHIIVSPPGGSGHCDGGVPPGQQAAGRVDGRRLQPRAGLQRPRPHAVVAPRGPLRLRQRRHVVAWIRILTLQPLIGFKEGKIEKRDLVVFLLYYQHIGMRSYQIFILQIQFENRNFEAVMKDNTLNFWNKVVYNNYDNHI